MVNLSLSSRRSTLSSSLTPVTSSDMSEYVPQEHTSSPRHAHVASPPLSSILPASAELSPSRVASYYSHLTTSSSRVEVRTVVSFASHSANSKAGSSLLDATESPEVLPAAAISKLPLVPEESQVPRGREGGEGGAGGVRSCSLTRMPGQAQLHKEPALTKSNR